MASIALEGMGVNGVVLTKLAVCWDEGVEQGGRSVLYEVDGHGVDRYEVDEQRWQRVPLVAWWVYYEVYYKLYYKIYYKMYYKTYYKMYYKLYYK